MLYLKNIKIQNFRCITNYKIDFSPHVNIIVGLNAVGKTSIVEAISVLCMGKSFKNVKDTDVLKIEESYYSILGKFIKDEQQKEIEIVVSYDGKNKKVVQNKKIYSNISDYVGLHKLVVFSPDDLEIIKGAPSMRRRFLDVNISQIKSEYLLSLIKYKRILKQRNEYLKSIDANSCDYTLLEVITSSLIVEIRKIIEFRTQYLDLINPYIEKASQKISGNKEIVKLKYEPNCEIESLVKTFKEKIKYDILTQTTNTGPARDDIKITINDQLATVYGSQGQIKTALLAIELGIVDCFNSQNEDLLVILDDVFSELDILRQIEIINLINQRNQIFITTTSINDLPMEIVEKAKILNLGKEKLK